MKISPLRLSPSKKSTLGGFIGSALFHAILITTFINFPIEMKPANEENMMKISLNSFNPPAPIPPAPEPVAAPPAPPPPEPVIIPEPIPEPVPEPVVIPEPKPEPKPIEKPESKPKPKHKKHTEKPVSKPEPTPAPPPPAQPTINTADIIAPAPAAPASPPKVAQAVAEFNFASSAGDERFSKIQQAIKKHQKYPKRAAKMKHQGVVEVSFLFKTDGSISNVKVNKSSGFDSLDEAAIETINRAFKDFPLLDKDYIIKIPMSYKLI